MPAIPLYADLDAQNVARLRNLPAPLLDGDAATKAYVDALIEGLAWKDNCRVATTANINLASAPSSIDGVTLTNGDRVLVKDQTDAKQNGIYIYNGAGNAMTRSPDANVGTELTNAVVMIDAGASNVGTCWRCTSINPTIGVDDITWEAFATAVPDASETTKGKIQIATQAETDAGTNDSKAITPLKLNSWSGRKYKYSATFGDAMNTSYTITHNLGTQDLVASVRRTSDNKLVYCEIEMTSANTVTVRLNSAPGNNALRITLIG